MRNVRVPVFTGDDLIYRFCSERGVSARIATPFEDLEAQVRALDCERPPTITFAGSDPLEHDDFPRLLELCDDLGLKRRRLVTDGFGLAHDVVVEHLEERGLDEVLVVLPTADPDRYVKVMRSRRRYEGCLAGLVKAADSGLRTWVVLPLVHSSSRGLMAFLDYLSGLNIHGVLVQVPETQRVPEGKRDLLIHWGEAAKRTAEIFAHCRRWRREIGVFERQPIAPCAADGALDDYGDLFNRRDKHDRVTGRRGLVRVQACETCDLRETCGGIEEAYLARFGSERLRPVTLEEANRWYTKPINRLDEIPYTRVSPYQAQRSGMRGLLRINGHCNMGCSFCFVDLSQPDVPEPQLLEEVDRLADAGVTHLVLSGGEPSLHPSLADVIRHGRQRGIGQVEIQTNGVRFAKRALVQKVADAGLTVACVSLHSSDPKESDRITKQPKAFQRTVDAIHNFRREQVWTRISHVVSKLNYRSVPQFVRWLRGEFETGTLDICFARAQAISSMASPWVLPSFDEIKPYVMEALDFCLQNDINFSGLIGQGGYPPCMLDGDLRYYEGAMDQIHRDASGGDDFYKATRCGDCSFDERCVGVRRAYVEAHGDDEIRPF